MGPLVGDPEPTRAVRGERLGIRICGIARDLPRLERLPVGKPGETTAGIMDEVRLP